MVLLRGGCAYGGVAEVPLKFVLVKAMSAGVGVGSICGAPAGSSTREESANGLRTLGSLIGSHLVTNEQRSGPAVMRIVQIAPLAESVPPKLYGGTERVVAWLVDELVGLGHEVTLFASGDSRTPGKLRSVWPCVLRLGRPAADPSAACTALLEAIARGWPVRARGVVWDKPHCRPDPDDL